MDKVTIRGVTYERPFEILNSENQVTRREDELEPYVAIVTVEELVTTRNGELFVIRIEDNERNVTRRIKDLFLNNFNSQKEELTTSDL